MKILLILSFLLISLQAFGQIAISGRVIDKQDGLEIPGVNILEKGSKNGTITDTKGYFKIEVADSNSILVISFIGYKPQEIQIDDSRVYLIKLKVDCHIDFWDYNDICIGISSGLLKSPIGGFGYITFPFVNISTLFGGFDYQTDLSGNYKLDIGAGALHILADCDLDGDILLNYKSLTVNDFTLNSYIIEGKLNFSNPKIFPNYSTLFLGYGLSDLSKLSTGYQNNSGILLGFGTRIGRPLYLNVNLKTIYWMDFWEFIGEVKWQYKNLVFSANYNEIDSYDEINLKFGYIFNY